MLRLYRPIAAYCRNKTSAPPKTAWLGISLTSDHK